VWLAVAIFAGIVMTSLNLEVLENRQLILWVGGITFIALVLVLIPGFGVEVNGARRWLGVGSFRFQASEFAKFGFVLVFSYYLASNQRRMGSIIHGFLIPCSIIGLTAGLVLLEPDFGTAFLCGIVGATMLFLAGARLIYLIPSFSAALLLFSIAVFFDPVRLKRITSFLDVEANRSDGAYQLWQGILAFGAGGVDGVGLGHGRQQLSFLPEAHTDFIFPIIGEELGLVFSAGVAALFLLIFALGIIGLRRAPNLFQFSLACGALFFLVYQALINMGVVTGCLPTKGMSLPFISYGGSNLIVMYMMVGLLLNCFRTWAKPPCIRMRDL
jgi:cell division protein FtsW